MKINILVFLVVFTLTGFNAENVTNNNGTISTNGKSQFFRLNFSYCRHNGVFVIDFYLS